METPLRLFIETLASAWVAAIIFSMVAMSNAPLGYQDEKGFHFGYPPA